MNINHIIRSISGAEIGVSKLNGPILESFSINNICHLLNNLVNFEDAHYFQIGIEDGNLFVPALYKNKPKSAYALDIWRSKDLKKLFTHNCCWLLEAIKYKSSDGYKQDLNFFTDKINIYFYNGDLNEETDSLKYYYDIFQDEFIFMTTNFNIEKVQNQITSSINELNLKILHQYKKLEWKNGFYLWLLKK